MTRQSTSLVLQPLNIVRPEVIGITPEGDCSTTLGDDVHSRYDFGEHRRRTTFQLIGFGS